MTAPTGPSARAKTLHKIVRDTGFVPEITADGAVRFKAEGKTYLIPDDTDQPFIRIIHQEIRKVRDEQDRIVLESIALTVSTTTKVAKVYVAPDQVWVVAELYCWPVEGFAGVLLRSLGVLDYAAERFKDALRSGGKL